MPNEMDPRRYTVQSVAKALRLIDLVAAAPAEGMTLSDIARQADMSKSAGYGLVRTLVDAGFLRTAGPGPRYALGLALVRLGDQAGRQLPVSEATDPILQELRRETGLTIRLALIDDGYPVFVQRHDGIGAVRFHAPLGIRELPHSSAAGKAILATLSEDEVQRIAAESGLPWRTRKTISDLETLRRDLALIRQRGYAVDDEEDVEGVFCVAATFYDHAGRCAGALSATGIKSDMPAWRLEELGQTIRSGADRVTGLLNGKRLAMVNADPQPG
jgi:IclR family acetate operon transcriptional repressor